MKQKKNIDQLFNERFANHQADPPSHVWDKVLSQTEINQFLLCPPTGLEPNLLGYWNFEEGSGTTAYDQTSNGNNGTINGATYDTNVPSQSCALTNANGCDSVITTNLTITTVDGINGINNGFVNVYPNPTSNGIVNITSSNSEAIQAQVFDILGKQVLNNTISNNRLFSC